MGVRYRKSINLGGGFRINLSSSGVGYSWGVKGYRVTKTAKGTIRHTSSIPGTGISFVRETRLPNQQEQNQQHNQSIDNNHYDTEEIANNVTSSTVSEGLEDILAMAERTLLTNLIATIGICVSLILCFFAPISLLLLCLFIGLKIYVNIAGLVSLNYEIDEDQKEIVKQHMEPMIKITESDKVWRIMQSSKVIDQKYSGGASNTIKRIPCQVSKKAPFPFKTNIPVASFKSGTETLIFLPDKLFIIQGIKIGALNYSDITTSACTTRFIKSENVPKDATIIDKTWKYVNKSGGPDKRFKDNRQLPICLYGEIDLKSETGLNTVLMFSNPNFK